ncbi:hypothetical protein N7495_001378 [Penicillium taxi]|uniref:uncharacterized protein n=1 Tax=Penicillium taxi TaxID=168475 RepID=UPI002544DDD7|nr:uncharacterized protein N7495_001378 [Penicillium taxi]KAJ5908696.1 hypothetical protein N7495_001378 [Penicillium taxi]
MRLSESTLLLVTLSVPLVAAERILGAYIFARHGDRTPKVFGSTQLTDLGYREVFQTGTFYHNRYILNSSDHKIEGISEYVVKAKQVNASAPSDAVLQNSATGFLQGVYPPVGSKAIQTLGNGTTVESPLGGYQLIQISSISSGSNSESSAWLQGSTGCDKATISSNNYYDTASYKALLNSTEPFYKSISPTLSKAFTSSQMTFENAYSIFDYLNVARIHNASSNTANITDADWLQLISLAGVHEYNLAYNASDKVRAIAGAVLSGQMWTNLNANIASNGTKNKLNVQFGSYGTFFSWVGLMQLPAAFTNFTSIPDYASSMVLELVTNATGTTFPSSNDINVRFSFRNGSMGSSDELTVYPLFNQSSTSLPWSNFTALTKEVAVLSTSDWCNQCGNTDGSCATTSSAISTSSSKSSSSGGMPLAVAGVIGAMVTLAILVGLEALIFLVCGLRVAKRSKAARVCPTIGNPTDLKVTKS